MPWMQLAMGRSYRMGSRIAAPMLPRERNEARTPQKMKTPLM